MEYRLTIEEKPSYVYAKVRSDTPPKTGSVAYLETIASHCANIRCSAVLVEKCTPEPFSIWDTFSIAPKLAKTGVQRIKIAVTDKCAEIGPQTELSVMVGRTCALDVRIFSSVSEAESWLLSTEPHKRTRTTH